MDYIEITTSEYEELIRIKSRYETIKMIANLDDKEDEDEV